MDMPRRSISESPNRRTDHPVGRYRRPHPRSIRPVRSGAPGGTPGLAIRRHNDARLTHKGVAGPAQILGDMGGLSDPAALGDCRPYCRPGRSNDLTGTFFSVLRPAG